MSNTFSNVAEIKLSFKPHFKASDRPKITSPKDAFGVFMQSWDMNLMQYLEQFKVMLLNRANRVLGLCEVSQGGLNATYVDLKVVFALALKSGASGIVLCHNHPSGTLQASRQDILLTDKAKEVASLFDIVIFDHIIIGEAGYYSFADDGLL